MYTTAVFERKENELSYSYCNIEKVIRLSNDEFDLFSHNLLRDYDFIKDNADLMRFSENNTVHCILVVGENRQYGILVNSEGGNYARYSALLPNADSFLATYRCPGLAEIGSKLADMIDHIAETAANSLDRDSEYPSSKIDVDALGYKFDIDFDVNFELYALFESMVHEIEGVADVDKDKDDLIILWEPEHFPSADHSIDNNAIGNGEQHQSTNSALGFSSWSLSPLEEVLNAAGISQPSLNDVYGLTKILIDNEDFRVERARAILSSGLASVADVSELIEFLDEDNLYRFNIIPVSNAYELGRYWAQTDPDSVPEDISFEDYGQYCICEDKGVFTQWGYVYERERARIAPDVVTGIDTSLNLNNANEKTGHTSVLKAIEDNKIAKKTADKTGYEDKSPSQRPKKSGEEL